jgi:hypothetical protein
MKLYCVSRKHGRSPFQVCAYVEAETPKKAIALFAGDGLSEYIADGGKYRAALGELPERFWQMADYCRPAYIKAAGGVKPLWTKKKRE